MSEIRVRNTGTIKLFESDNTSHVTIASPASLSANRTITIPDADVNLTNIATNTAKTSNATHSGEVTGATALTIADNVVDEANLKISNSAVNGYALTAQSGNTGGLTWAEMSSGGSWDLIYSDNVSGMGSGSNAYTNSNMFSATYNFYRIYILNWEPQNDGVDMNLQFKLGGSTRTSNYRYNLRRNESNSPSVTGAYDNGASSIRIMEGCGSGTSEVMSGFFEYQNPTGDNGNFYVTNAMYSGIETNGYTIGGVGQGSCSDSTGAMTGFTIAAHSGGLGNYNLRAYGLKTS